MGNKLQSGGVTETTPATFGVSSFSDSLLWFEEHNTLYKYKVDATSLFLWDYKRKFVKTILRDEILRSNLKFTLLPHGWALCDKTKTNGTPEAQLRERLLQNNWITLELCTSVSKSQQISFQNYEANYSEVVITDPIKIAIHTLHTWRVYYTLAV